MSEETSPWWDEEMDFYYYVSQTACTILATIETHDPMTREGKDQKSRIEDQCLTMIAKATEFFSQLVADEA